MGAAGRMGLARRAAMAVGVAAALLFVVAPSRAGTSAPARTVTETESVAFDTMAYVAETPVDPWSVPQSDGSLKPDATSLHVALGGANPVTHAQSDVARSFVHVALDRLPPGALVGSVVATLYITDSTEVSSSSVYQTYNVDPNHEALMQACLLTKPIPKDLSRANEPPFDCAHGSAVGKQVTIEGAQAWQFDLTPLVKAWAQTGNTGAVIVPISQESGDAWAVAFSKGRSVLAKVTFAVPTIAPSGGTTSVAPPTYYRIPVTIAKHYPFPTAPPAAPQAAPPAAAPAPPVAEAPAAKPSHAWMWVLPACLGVALALALGHRRTAVTAGAPLRARMLMDVQRYPRSYAVGAIVSAWGLLFASYSAVVAPARTMSGLPGGPIAQGPSGAPSSSASSSARPSASTSTSYRTVVSGGGVVPGSEFAGPGVWRTIDGIPVFFPADGSAPAAKLYSGADDLIGIDYAHKTIKLCGHAALTFGPEFHINVNDINVFWNYLNTHGGINGWTFPNPEWNDDGYDPGKAVQAAQKCKDDGAFEILGGIGFDQIPAVRAWAESNQELYVHHIVTTAGSDGLRYSFTALPSEEQMGILAGQLAVSKFRGRKVGVIWRESPNWQSGRDLFEKIVRACACGMTVYDYPVTLNQTNYNNEILQLKNVNGLGPNDVVFAWENAVATDEMVGQAQGQNFHPSWIVFPFNLELATLDKPQGSFHDKMYGVAAWDAYDAGYYQGPFAAYQGLMREFEHEYAAENDSAGPNGGFGNDLLFLAWEGFVGLADMFRECLPECTRNRMAGILLTYHKRVDGFCDVDFTRLDAHHGGWYANTLDLFRDPRDNHLAWQETGRCIAVS